MESNSKLQVASSMYASGWGRGCLDLFKGSVHTWIMAPVGIIPF